MIDHSGLRAIDQAKQWLGATADDLDPIWPNDEDHRRALSILSMEAAIELTHAVEATGREGGTVDHIHAVRDAVPARLARLLPGTLMDDVLDVLADLWELCSFRDQINEINALPADRRRWAIVNMIHIAKLAPGREFKDVESITNFLAGTMIGAMLVLD